MQARGCVWLLLVAGGVAGPVLFTLVYLVLGATEVGYDPWRRPVSDLSAGGLGAIQVASFVVCGVSVIGFALAFIRSPSPAGGRWAPLLLIIVGVALLIAGIFITDPAAGYPGGNHSPTTTVHGAIHLVASVFVFTSLPAACFVMARRYMRAGLKAWAAYSMTSGILMWSFLLAFGLSNARGGPAGLFERMAIATGWAWISLQAVRLYRTRGPLSHG
jgi:hypothetical membrane protein